VGTNEDPEVWTIEVPPGNRIRQVIYFYTPEIGAINAWLKGLKCPPKTKSEAIRILVKQGLEKENGERI
jgi:hypothetical protein